MTIGLDGSTYTYDAQNRLLTASKGGTTDTFLYDGLNRQIGKQISGQSLYYRVYDGWNLLGEYKTGVNNATFAYLYGTGGIVKNVVTNYYYYQDAMGSTSHVATSAGALKEYYLYDLHGAPTFYNASGTKLSDTAIGVRHLFTGQQWYIELGLYDLRNRYYSPDIGRFLQTDPISFGGDATHLYRYCGNNPIVRFDPSGLGTGPGEAMGEDPISTGASVNPVGDLMVFGGLATVGGGIVAGSPAITAFGVTALATFYNIASTPAGQWLVQFGSDLGNGVAGGNPGQFSFEQLKTEPGALTSGLYHWEGQASDIYDSLPEDTSSADKVNAAPPQPTPGPQTPSNGPPDATPSGPPAPQSVTVYYIVIVRAAQPGFAFQFGPKGEGGFGTGVGAGTGMLGGWAGGNFANAAQAADYYNGTGDYSGGGGYAPGMGYPIVRVY